MELQRIPQLIARTDRWLVIDKPPGWLTIPGRGQDGIPVLTDWVRELEPGALVTHRLDRDTSGIVLFARDPGAHRDANEWFRTRRITKIYDFLAVGRLRNPVIRIREPVGGLPAITQIELKEKLHGSFRGLARPLTGRRHQIRIHLAGEGNPLLGDRRYGGPIELPDSRGERLQVSRVALHAFRLELPGGEAFEASWPEDFKHWVTRLRDPREESGNA